MAFLDMFCLTSDTSKPMPKLTISARKISTFKNLWGLSMVIAHWKEKMKNTCWANYKNNLFNKILRSTLGIPRLVRFFGPQQTVYWILDNFGLIFCSFLQSDKCVNYWFFDSEFEKVWKKNIFWNFFGKKNALNRKMALFSAVCKPH